MKIILVGPFPPLRGGISMFNHSLANELEKNHEVHRISFSLQYPKFMKIGPKGLCALLRTIVLSDLCALHEIKCQL